MSKPSFLTEIKKSILIKIGAYVLAFTLAFGSVSNALAEEIKRVQDYIAVLDLQTKEDVPPKISAPLTEKLQTEIINSRKYKVVDRAHRDQILKEQGFQLKDCVTSECIVEAGQLLGVGKIVTGSISKIGETYYINTQLINVETGVVEGSADNKCKKCELDELIDLVGVTGKRLMGLRVPERIRKPGSKMQEEIHVVFETSKGNITCVLYPKQAPKTVENFIGLAKGTKEWIDPRTREKVKVPLYDGTIFHRVIPKFMIQGGDPLGTGIGGPGYRFEDEIVEDLTFDRPGKLAMANSGPDTNGSQFFITVVPTPHLNGRHTIFGQVIEGQDVVDSMTKVERDKRDKPLEPIVLKKVLIK